MNVCVCVCVCVCVVLEMYLICLATIRMFVL